MTQLNLFCQETTGLCNWYRKFPKYSDTRKFAVLTLKVEHDGFSLMHPKDAEGIANSVDPDQSAPLGAVWAGSALFAQTCLSENLGKYRRKFPKYSDIQNICCNHSKIWTMWLYHRVMSPNNADGMTNSRPWSACSSSLIWVCTVCPGISVRNFRIIAVP